MFSYGQSTCATATFVGALPYNLSTTTCGAGDNYNQNDACGSNHMRGDDYVFEYTPNTAQALQIDLTGTDYKTGVFIMDGCPDLGVTSCIDFETEFFGNPSMLTPTLTAGTTYYIVVSTNPGGWVGVQCTDFTIDIQCISPTCPPTVQDCDGAIAVCNSSYSEESSYAGEGNYPNEIPSTSCLGSETNSVWYIFTVQTSGDLSFDITPNDLDDDYDWAVYDLTNNNCSDIFTDPSLELSCNYSAASGVTGANGGSTNSSQGAGGTNSNAVIPVTAGDILYLAVQNWTGSTNGYDIDFSTSTATVFDDVAPFIQAVATPIPCGETTLSFNFSETILCSSFDVSDLALTGPGGPYTLSALSGAACVGTPVYTSGQENNFTVTVSPPLTNSGTFSLCLLAGSSVEDLCGNTAPAACLDFDIVNGVTVLATADQTICDGYTPSSLNASSASAGTYSWVDAADPLGIVLGTGSNFSPPPLTTTTTYTVTFTDVNGCIATDIVTITVNPLLTVTASSSPASPLCDGDALTLNGGGATTYTWDNGVIDNTPFTPGTGTVIYTVTGTDVNLCYNTATISVTVNPLPTATIAFSETACLGGVVPDLLAYGTLPTWYSDAALTTQVYQGSWYATGQTAVGLYTYYVTETLNGCEGPSVPVTLEIYAIPAAPTAANEVACEGGVIPDLTTTVVTWTTPTFWYSDAGLTVVVGNGSTLATGQTAPGIYTYYVSETDVNGCESAGTPVTLEIYAIPITTPIWHN